MTRPCLTLLAVALAGCFNPDDVLPLHGRVNASEPAGQQVRLLRGAGRSPEGDCASPRAFKETTVADDGTFSFDVLRAQAQRLTDASPFCFRAETTFPSGTVASATLLDLPWEYTLPPLPEWRPRLQRGASSLWFTEANVPEGSRAAGWQSIHRAELVLADGGIAWAGDWISVAITNQAETRSKLEGLGPEELEDFEGVLRVSARFLYDDLEVGLNWIDDTTVELHSGETIPVQGTTQPLSRYDACDGYEDPCPFTDGLLEPVDAGQATSVTVRFIIPRLVSRVVVRRAVFGATPVIARVADSPWTTLGSTPWTPSLWDAPADLRLGAGPFDASAFAGVTLLPRDVSIEVFTVAPIDGLTVVFPEGVSSLAEISVFY